MNLLYDGVKYMEGATSNILQRKEGLLKSQTLLQQLSRLSAQPADPQVLARALGSSHSNNSPAILSYAEASPNASVRPSCGVVKMGFGRMLAQQGVSRRELQVMNKTAHMLHFTAEAAAEGNGGGIAGGNGSADNGGGCIPQWCRLQPAEFDIPPGLSTTVQVVVDTDAVVGELSAALALNCNLAAETAIVDVAGSCQEVDLQFDQEVVDFGLVGTDQKVARQKLTIQNGTGVQLRVKARVMGFEALTGTVLAVEPDVMSREGVVLEAWQAKEVTVRADLHHEEDVGATLQVSRSQALKPSSSFAPSW
jgi:hypothetical protein